MKTRLALALAALTVAPAAALAQNDSHQAAANLTTNGPSIQQFYNTANPERWYRYKVAAGQSYCVEAGTAFTENQHVDTFIEVFESDGTTLIDRNDDAEGEPDSYRGSRLCYTANASAAFDLVKVRSHSIAASANPTRFQVRVTSNMLYNPWWFTHDGFESYITLRNTTSSPVAITVNVRDLSGALVGAPLGRTLAANAGAVIAIRSTFGVLSGSGSVDIASNAAPGAVVGSITTVNHAKGDTASDRPFTLRQQPSW
jgi:hypothetical protein